MELYMYVYFDYVSLLFMHEVTERKERELLPPSSPLNRTLVSPEHQDATTPTLSISPALPYPVMRS